MKIVSKHLDASPGDIIVGGGFYHTCILLEKNKMWKKYSYINVVEIQWNNFYYNKSGYRKLKSD